MTGLSIHPLHSSHHHHLLHLLSYLLQRPHTFFKEDILFFYTMKMYLQEYIPCVCVNTNTSTVCAFITVIAKRPVFSSSNRYDGMMIYDVAAIEA